jgi:hypothetical protein
VITGAGTPEVARRAFNAAADDAKVAYEFIAVATPSERVQANHGALVGHLDRDSIDGYRLQGHDLFLFWFLITGDGGYSPASRTVADTTFEPARPAATMATWLIRIFF